MAKQRIDERIDAALSGQRMEFGDLARALYPDKRSWRYQSNGGPPGCYMALSAALRRYGYHTSFARVGHTLGRRMVHPRRAALNTEQGGAQ